MTINKIIDLNISYCEIVLNTEIYFIKRVDKGQIVISVNSFHPALKYTWEISEHSLAFLDIKISINGNSLSTSVHYKPTDSHNYLLHSSSHPQHVRNAIPFSQFLRLRRLCSSNSDFNNKCEEMCQFFKKRGYPDSAITTGKHRAQEIDRNTALQSPQNKETNRIPFTLTYHPQNLAVKNVILKNFKILRNDPETQHIFSLPPLISFKRDKNIGTFLVRSAFKSDNQPGTFKRTRTRCKTCPFISNMVKISGHNRSAKITDHFTCISANVIYCITCTLCKKIYIGETGRRLADRFREHLRDVEKNDTDASKPVARHFNLPNHSHHNMTFWAYPYTTETQKAVKISNKNLFFNWAHSIHTESMNASHSINLFTNSRHPISTNSKLLRTHINLQQPQFLYSLRRRANART